MISKTLFSKLYLPLFLLVIVHLFTHCEREEELLTKLERTEKKTAINTRKSPKPDHYLNSRSTGLSGYYRGYDNGHYYIRQFGDEIIWFAEDPDGEWAHVFKGRVLENNGFQFVNGSFYAVPKGRSRESGTKWVIINGPTTPQIVKSPAPDNLPGSRSGGFGNRDNIDDLTGRWSVDDRGIYYIYHLGSLVIWYGEQNYVNGKPVWSNVGFGTKTGNTITLEWADVPKGRNNGNGVLTLNIDSAQKMTTISATGGFGGKVWTR